MSVAKCTPMNTGIVCFAHGRDSGPRSTKIERFSALAEARGFRTLSPDFSSTVDPEERVRILLREAPREGRLVLVGSSMGGYVVTEASSELRPWGLFLLAPAFYMAPYADHSPRPQARATAVVHGWRDDVIPVDNSIRFAREHRAELTLVDDDHRLLDRLPLVDRLLEAFLDRAIEEP
jgi:alpha/beta superfamily hydrolase